MKHLIVGFVLVGLGVCGMVAWWDSFGFVMRGIIPFALLAVGLVALLSGLHRLGTSPPSTAAPRSAGPGAKKT